MPEMNREEEMLTVCLNQSINFIDESTQGLGSEIKNWHWDFGDNTTYSSSTTANPVHSYSRPGDYVVKLTVKNACNCTTTYYLRVHVLEEQGVTITCASIVCERNEATYTVEGLPCEIPKDIALSAWSVVGGTITSFSGNSIVITWDDRPNLESGFGYVSFNPAFCREFKCPKITTIKIPVILNDGTITGNKSTCIGKSYIYRFPAWPGTAFTWTIYGSSSGPITPVFTDQPNEVVIVPTQNESITIECNYYTDLTGCKGIAKYEINVGAAVFIDGPTTAFQSSTVSFNLAGTPSGNWRWVVRNPLGIYSYYNNPPYNTLDLSGLIAGTYMIDVDQCPDFCLPASFTLKVEASPAAPTAISGPTEICPNNVYEYTASSTQSGYEFMWELTAGTGNFQGSNMGPTASIKFTGSGPWTLSVKRVNMAQPDCPSTALLKNITQIIIPANVITGDLSACPNTRKNYACTYTNAEYYRWTISPSTAGSVESGDGTPNISILWNNNSSGLTKTLKLKLRKCGVEYTRTYDADVTISPSISLSYTSPVCRGTSMPIGLNITPSVSSPILNWDFGNGSTITNGGTSQSVVYSAAIDAPASYPISVSLTGYAGCSNIVPIVATGTVSVNPTPMVKLTPATNYTHCGYPFSIPIGATLTTGYGSTSQLL